MMRFLCRWGPALGLMIVIFIMSSQPKSDVPDFGVWDLPVKKGSHMIGYALLGVAMLRGVRGDALLARRHYVWALVLTALYAMTDEYHQTFVPGRGGNVWDVGVDALGATISLSLRWRQALRLQRPLATPSPSKTESSRR